MAVRVFRRLAEFLDVNITSAADGEVLSYDSATSKWVNSAAAGGGAPADATYLTTTANASLSAEVVVGATPGGELGGTWAAPTVDATHSGSSHASVQAAAEATAAAALTTHAADTTSVHGITDTSALETTSGAQAKVDAHVNDTTAAHAASALSVADAGGNFSGTDVETVLAELASAPSIVTSLPGSPSDNEEVYFQVGTGDTAVLWHLKYDADVTDSYKWRAVGVCRTSHIIDTGESRAANTYGDLTTVGPTLTTPLAGIYDIEFGCEVVCGSGSQHVYVTPKLGSAATSDTDGANFVIPGGGWSNTGHRRMQRTLAASDEVRVQYKTVVNTTSMTYSKRYLHLIPVRVG